MNIFARVFAGILGALLGIVIILLWQMLLGEGLQFVPFSRFVIPIIISAITGFVLGVIFHKIVLGVFHFLGRFGVELR